MSVVSQVILQADDQLRYPTSGELKGIQAFLTTGAQRIRIAETLAENEKKIVDQAQNNCLRSTLNTVLPEVMPTVSGNIISVCAITVGICA